MLRNLLDQVLLAKLGEINQHKNYTIIHIMTTGFYPR